MVRFFPTTIFKEGKRYVLILTVLVLVVIGVSFLAGQSSNNNGTYPEVAELRLQERESFQDYATYFRKLAESKDAKYAFEVLKRASFPPNIDLHLLAHVVGDVLYKQQGIEGIHVCTQDFRNACSHSVVIGILNEQGEGALNAIADTCRQAPGGRGAYTMCFHGLGHGVLAYNGYDYEKAIGMCKKTGTSEYQNREYIECVGGMTMEMIAGVHDEAAWKAQKDRYFKKDDPLAPCNASYVPEDARPMCYNYLTPHLFEAAGMDIGFPDPKLYPEAFAFCDALPEENLAERDACYGGFGKEFIVLAQSRDVRDVGSMKEQALHLIRDWCSKTGNLVGEVSCNASALASLFWGGENNPDASFLFCEIASGQAQNDCYNQLGGHIRYYLADDPRGRALCARLPDTYQHMCTL